MVKFYNYFFKTFLLILFVCSLLLTFSCNKKIADVYSPKEWRDLLDTAGHWVPLTIPDSRYTPASIVYNPADTLRWVGHMKSCNFPDGLLKPVLGQAPEIKFSKAKEFSADALVNYSGIEVGPKFNDISKIQLIVDDHGTEAIDMIKLKVWWEIPKNKNKVSSVCMDELSKKDFYMVQEVFQVSKGKYVLYDKKGVAIKLKAEKLKEIIKIQPDVKFSVTTDGALSINQPTTIAVRRVAKVGNDWRFLKNGNEENEFSDSKIEKLFFDNTKNK